MVPGSGSHRLGARVRRLIDLLEAFDAGVRVDLRGGDAGVTEQFLHRAQVAAGLQQMARERMAQDVRMHVGGDTAHDREPFEPDLHGAVGQPAPERTQEQRPLVAAGMRGAPARARAEPAPQRLAGFALMSDGCAESLYDKRSGAPAAAISKLVEWNGDLSRKKMVGVLNSNMQQAFSRKTADDCSLAVISIPA